MSIPLVSVKVEPVEATLLFTVLNRLSSVVVLVALVRVAASLVTAASQFFTACRPVLLAVA